jgi:serine/threonine protein kinase
MSGDGRRQFEIVRCLGAGGFGEVYQAIMTSPGGLATTVALKVLRSDLHVSDDAMRRLHDEGKVLGRLDHPSIVRAYDLTRIDGRVALVTEYVDGADLDRCFEASEPLSHRALLQVTAQVADALDAAWNARGPQGQLYMVHRDIKPSNIRIGRHGQVKLLDFGIARFEGAREARTASDVVMGSLPYMAPERFVDRKPRSASDVFSLGCCLYEGLAGEPLYPDARLTTMSTLALDDDMHREHVDARIESLDVPDEIRELVVAALHYDPDARPTAAALGQGCEELADDASGASLRRWCADHDWREGQETHGSLEGRVLHESGLTEPNVAPKPESDRRPPRMMREAHGTLDPAQGLEAEPQREIKPMAGRRVDTPVAPPAFPSIPLGMAVKKGDQISFKELEDTVGTDLADELANQPTAESAKVPPSARPTLINEPAPAPRSAPPTKGGSRGLLIAAAVLLGLTGVAVLTGVFALLLALLVTL